MIGDDLYDIRATARRGRRRRSSTRRIPSKPFAFPEWGLWGFDDPQFVRDMAKWLRSHKRVEFAAYYSGRAGSVWDLASKPALAGRLPRADHPARMIEAAAESSRFDTRQMWENVRFDDVASTAPQ